MNIQVSPAPDSPGFSMVNIPPDEFLQHLQAYQEQTQDLRLIKENVYKLLEKIGLINPDGSFRESINMKMLMDVGMKVATGNEKFKKDMAFISEMLPIILKYKNL